MQRIPAGQTIAFAYNFVLGNFPALLGIVWFPTLLYSGLLFPYFRFYGDGIEMLVAGQTGPGVLLMAASYIFFILASFLFAATILVGIVRIAHGLTAKFSYFYLEIDNAVLRVVWAGIRLLFLYMLVSFVISFILALMLGVAAAISGPEAAQWLPPLAFAVIIGAFFYGLVRYLFLLVPVIVHGEAKELRRSWSLSSGNAGAISAILFATIVPGFVLQIALQTVVAPSFMATALMQADAAADPVGAIRQMREGLWGALPLLLPIWIILSAALYGLLGASAAYAYRILVQGGGGNAADVFD